MTKQAKVALTHEMLTEMLSYDPLTGIFRWKVSRYGRTTPGQIAGTKTNARYIQIWIGGIAYRASRLAWFYQYGTWPSNVMDHIDGNRSNDAIANLRDVSHAVNGQNKHQFRTRRVTRKRIDVPLYHY